MDQLLTHRWLVVGSATRPERMLKKSASLIRKVTAKEG